MKKYLFVAILLFALTGCNILYGQGEIISSKTVITTRDLQKVEEIRTYSTKFDSILRIEDDKIYFISNSKENNIDLDYHTILTIEISNNENNRNSDKKICSLHQEYLKQREIGRAVGNFIAGATFIFLAHPTCDIVTRKMEIRNGEDADDFIKRTRKTYNGIYWSMTGVGAIFEIIGVYKLCKVTSGQKINWGITNNGATIIYKFP